MEENIHQTTLGVVTATVSMSSLNGFGRSRDYPSATYAELCKQVLDFASGRVFCGVNRAAGVWGDGMAERLSGTSSVGAQRKPASTNSRHGLRESARGFATLPEANWN